MWILTSKLNIHFSFHPYTSLSFIFPVSGDGQREQEIKDSYKPSEGAWCLYIAI